MSRSGTGVWSTSGQTPMSNTNYSASGMFSGLTQSPVSLW